jgi:hypothetical protein
MWKAYPSASGTTKCCSRGGEFVLEQITNITASASHDDRLSTLLDRNVDNGTGNGVGSGNLTISAADEGSLPTATGAAGGAPLGWNVFHALYCLHFIYSSGNQWTYVYSKETPANFSLLRISPTGPTPSGPLAQTAA